MNNNGPMFNAYPDSIGENLSDVVSFLKQPEMKDTLSSFYILPSMFNTDLDRGFSVIDYELNEVYASLKDLNDLNDLGIDLKLDFIMNHCSVLSKQFQDILTNGVNSKYRDFFINWNEFWKGHGTMTEDGYIMPDKEYLDKMFFRKPGLPILMVRMPDGTNVPYWNTFYQEVKYEKVDAQTLMKEGDMQYLSAKLLSDKINQALEEGKKPSEIEFGRFEGVKEKIVSYLESKRQYLGQMDVNIKSPLVWEFYENTLKTLAAYGAKIIRLDAFAYAPKEPGEKNFLNDPGTWDLLEKVHQIAENNNLSLLPEIHASYEEGIYRRVADKGYMTYDFFLPGLIIDALERKSGNELKRWADELMENNIRVVNMLGCHDGIPLLDLKGMIADEQIETLIHTIVERGGYVKNLHGQKNMYYQVNATYYSALGEDDRKMLLARAIQLFMPGKPQVWYLDLFAGKNDYEAVERAGAGGHKEINRTNLSLEEIQERLKLDVVKKQIEMLRFRNEFPAFGFDSKMEFTTEDSKLSIRWEKENCKAMLSIDFSNYMYEITGIDGENNTVFSL